MLQSFDWYQSDDGQFFNKLAKRAAELKSLGINAVWLPPVCKATGTNDVGYGVYDLYDLGEFDIKGARRTKYGNKEELLACIDALHQQGISVYADLVLNHKAAADYTERCQAVKVNPNNRNENISDAHEIEAWTGFNFPARKDKYSDFKWHWYHFTGVDFDNATGENGVFRILGDGKSWSDDVSAENGNFDYLMFADIDYAHPEVIEETKRWAEWFIKETNIDGVRLDAIKHIDTAFMSDFISHILNGNISKENFYVFGEYWIRDPESNSEYLYKTDYDIDLFDVGLHFAFFDASTQKENYDLRKLFDQALVKIHPAKAVTFVDNHDTQPGQALTSWVETWFKAIAYACILLRKDGYPCLFSADLDGMSGPYPQPAQRESLEKLLKLRMALAYGDQNDYLEDPHCIGFVRHGEDLGNGERHKLAVVFSNDEWRKYAPGEESYRLAEQAAASADKVENEESMAASKNSDASKSDNSTVVENNETNCPSNKIYDNPSEASDNPWTDKGLFITMNMGVDQAGKIFKDHFYVFKDERVIVDDKGFAVFPVPARNLSCWAEENLDLDKLISDRNK